MKKLKFAIIGCGRISHKHVDGIANNGEHAQLVGVCDLIIEKAQKSADLYKDKISVLNNDKEIKSSVNIYTDYKKMLKELDIDVITIATESGYHKEISLDCLNSKKHVIVEKPMALSCEDAESIIKVAKLNNKKLCVCHQNRFNESIQKLREAIDEDRFGKLINGTARILWNRDENYYNQAKWRGTWEMDGGTLMNQCIHNIDLLQWMMGGEIDTVYAQIGTFLRDIEAEDFGSIILRFKNGSIGIVEGSACVYPENLEETLSIFGENGTVCIGGLAVNKIETWRFKDELENENQIISQDSTDIDSVYGFGHTKLFKDMIDAIRYDRDPLVTGEEGKKALDIILAAYKSQKTNETIKMDKFKFNTLEMRDVDIKY